MCEWLTIFKNCCTDVTIEERSGQPFTSCTDESIQLVCVLILNNLQAIIDKMAKHLPIMHGSANALPYTLQERTNATFSHSAKAFCITIAMRLRHSWYPLPVGMCGCTTVSQRVNARVWKGNL
jgi:hypothetical protein